MDRRARLGLLRPRGNRAEPFRDCQVPGPFVRGKAAPALGRLDLPHTFTYVEDYGRALAAAALSPEAHGRAWIVPNDRTSPPGSSRGSSSPLRFTNGRTPRSRGCRAQASPLPGFSVP